jgi:hypothetical protein
MHVQSRLEEVKSIKIIHDSLYKEVENSRLNGNENGEVRKKKYKSGVLTEIYHNGVEAFTFERIF